MRLLAKSHPVEAGHPDPWLTLAAVAGLLALAATGCGDAGRTAAAAGAGTDAARGTYEAEGHDTPSHKPTGFPAALAALRRRTDALRSELEGPTGTASGREYVEMTDIVGWLPTLAADSDLTEAEWQPIRAAADDLARLLPLALAGRGDVRRDAFAAIDRRLDGLVAAAAAHPGAFETTPRHDHHDHDHDHD